MIAEKTVGQGYADPPMTEPPADRRSKAETRDELIAAARRLLADGRPVMIPNVTLKEAIAESGVPRSSAYRAYESDIGQLAAFRDAVAQALSHDDGATPPRASQGRALEESQESR